MALKDHPIADSDLHVMEPADLWQRYLAPEYRHAAPVGLTELKRDMRVRVKNDVLLRLGTVRPEYVEGRKTGWRAEHEDVYADGEASGWDPASQLRAMDAEGLDLAVLFPSRGLFVLGLDSTDHVGPEGLGQMRAAPAIGAAVVALWLSWRPLTTNVGAKMLWAVAAFGVATIAFGLSRDLLLSMAVLSLLGAADMVSVFVRSSLIQINTPDDMRGRVSAISGLAISASNELGEMQSGVAAALVGATGAVVFGGAGAIVVTILWAWMFPELRRARTFAPQFRQREPEQ